jgi:predicted transcriptional regulator
MPPNHIYEPSDAELEILQVLWEHEPATVRTVFEILEKKRDVGYTTILKQMQRMYEKGMVKRDKDGKGHVYTAVPREEEIKKTLLDDLVDKAFKGSAMDLVMHALGRADTSPEELEALKKWLEEQDED